MASPSTSYGHRVGRRRQSRRNRNVSSVVNVEEFSAEASPAPCIDLTADVSGYDVIDLTSPYNLSIMDSPIVVLTATDDVGPARRRGSGRRGRHRSGSRRRIPFVDVSTPLDTRSQTRSQQCVLLTEDSDLEDMPGSQYSQSGANANDGILQSPATLKVSCPVCLDDTKQIRQSGRQIMSTTCGHIFCNVCIKQAINAQNACPSCRKNFI